MRKSGRQLLTLAIFVAVNLCFTVKYGLRVGVPAAIAASTGYVLMVMFIVARQWLWARVRRFPVILSVYTVLAAAAVIAFFPPGTFDVDRWDMIQAFCSQLEQGRYPYVSAGLTNDNVPAQSPFYFLICYPFYKAGLYVGLPLISLWIWWIVAVRDFRDRAVMTTLLLMTSPAFVYEVLTLSTIFFNSVIVFAWMTLYRRYRDMTLVQCLVAGFIGGLMMATRNVFAIPVIFICMMQLLNGRKRYYAFVTGGAVILSYAAVFLPFIFGWGLDAWQSSNPFSVQSEVILSTGVMALLIAASVVWAALSGSDWSRAVFASGVMLFASAVAVIAETSVNVGFHTAFIASRADITYLIFCLPFILIFIKNKICSD